jgi:D-tyrosyl-tRNA(Tyr) deacylase
MRAVVQRVKQSTVTADNEIVGQIGNGLLVLLGVAIIWPTRSST